MNKMQIIGLTLDQQGVCPMELGTNCFALMLVTWGGGGGGGVMNIH